MPRPRAEPQRSTARRLPGTTWPDADMAAAATAAPAQRRRSSGSASNVRPLSAAQLLFPDGGGCGGKSDVTSVAIPLDSGGGVENEAFELGSPLSPGAAPRPQDIINNNSRDAAPRAALSRQASRDAREADECSSNNNIEEDTPTADPELSRGGRSWLLDAAPRRKDDNEMWRRRKTDPPGDGKYSYHRDYQEALSSLLWQPYDCRGQGSNTANVQDDADVSVWLYPPVARRPKPYGFRSSGCQSSSSSSTSSMASTSSSTRGVVPEESNGEVDGRHRKVGNIPADPNQHVEEVVQEDVVSDLHTPWLGTTAAAVLPVGALQSRCVDSGCPLCEACQCLEERAPDAMLVSVSAAATPATPATPSVGNSVSVVNCYRAVPVLVSAVPAIPCSSSECNVHIVQTTPVERAQRTFTSTEAQTDEVEATPPVTGASSNNREQRRRERRERRHQRRLNTHNSLNGPHHHEPMWQAQAVPPPLGGERLPDILNSHLPPPYTLGMHPPPPAPHPPPPPPVPVPVPPPMPTVSPGSPSPHHPPGMRFPFQITPTGRRRTRGQHYTPEEEPKSCCGVVVTQTVSIRWFIVLIAFVGICCAVVGTALGAMKASGREHLTVSLLMIGVGIVLITVSGVAWRLTAHDAPSCRMMLGLGGGEESSAEPNRRFVPRLPPSYGRPHHPYAAMMYPEFQYRPPPPSYQASMQEYRLRLLLLDRHPGSVATNPSQAVSPPPTYRSHAGSTLSRATLALRRDQLQSDYSRPPSYRSRTSSTRPALDPNGNTGCSTAEHSRDPSLSLSESGRGSAVVNVISVMGNGGDETETLDNIKLVPDQDMPLRMMLNKGCHSGGGVDGVKDGNLVTIVQTGNDSSPVIVTVSGSTMATTTMGGSSSGNGVDTEMEILAHL